MTTNNNSRSAAGNRRTHRSRRRAVSLAEVAVSALLTGVLLIAALQAVGQSMLSQTTTALRCQGRAMAEGLLAEVGTRAYREPDGATTLGTDTGEALPRQNYDDVDDYRGYEESPPQTRTGGALSWPAGWRRRVEVDWVDAATTNTVSSVETGVKRITVTASFHEVNHGRAVGIRCDVP